MTKRSYVSCAGVARDGSVHFENWGNMGGAEYPLRVDKFVKQIYEEAKAAELQSRILPESQRKAFRMPKFIGVELVIKS